jgi:hypothetical protein
MTLNPERYKCPQHPDVDVTDQVQAKLSPGRPDVVFRGSLFGRKAASGPEPFEVTVVCSGDDGAHAHLIKCTGTQVP